MAAGRFVSRSISTNEQLATVSIDAALLFTWCIPHLDVDGRLAGSPMSIKANVLPVRDEISIKRITKLIEELGAVVDRDGTSLVVLYEVGRQQVLMFPGFGRHQKGLRRDRESGSKLPPLSTNARILAGSISRTGSRSNSGTTPGVAPGVAPEKCPQGEGEVEGQGKGQGEGAMPAPSPRQRVLAERLISDADRRAMDALLKSVPVPDTWIDEMLASLDGMPGHVRASPEQLGRALRDYAGNGALAKPGLNHFRAYVRRAVTPERAPSGASRSSESDDLQARVKHAHLLITARRQKVDGDEWWERAVSAARDAGKTNDRDVILYAAQRLETEAGAAT